MKRKTVDVQEVKDYVNKVLSISTGEMTKPTRIGMASLLEHILSKTGNYKGYNNLEQHQVPHGELPGIIFDKYPGTNHQYPDDSRRFYY